MQKQPGNADRWRLHCAAFVLQQDRANNQQKQDDRRAM
jgi:hypothetical protein